MLHSELHTKLHSPTSYDHMIIDQIIEHFNINSNRLESIEFDTICEMAREEYNQNLKDQFIGNTKKTKNKHIINWLDNLFNALRPREPNDYCEGCGHNWYNPNKENDDAKQISKKKNRHPPLTKGSIEKKYIKTINRRTQMK